MYESAYIARMQRQGTREWSHFASYITRDFFQLILISIGTARRASWRGRCLASGSILSDAIRKIAIA